MEFTKVRDFDMLVQASLEVLDKAWVAGCDDAVIDMDGNDCDFILVFV